MNDTYAVCTPSRRLENIDNFLKQIKPSALGNLTFANFQMLFATDFVSKGLLTTVFHTVVKM